MTKIKLKLPKLKFQMIREYFSYSLLCLKSLGYNHHLSQSYCTGRSFNFYTFSYLTLIYLILDILIEPIFKIVDSKIFSLWLGPFFVVAVVALISSIVFFCYYIGLPYWWALSQEISIFLIIFGNWILLNVMFHYYMACSTDPGQPPRSETYNAVSICKKCLIPKPPRTHHCSICNKCILLYDHHCPWMNRCIGHKNRRYFFLFMAYTVFGVIFIMTFGLGIGYNVLWLGDYAWEEKEPLRGALVRYNLTGHLVPVTEVDYDSIGVSPASHNLPITELKDQNTYRAVVYMAITVVGEIFLI